MPLTGNVSPQEEGPCKDYGKLDLVVSDTGEMARPDFASGAEVLRNARGYIRTIVHKDKGIAFVVDEVQQTAELWRRDGKKIGLQIEDIEKISEAINGWSGSDDKLFDKLYELFSDHAATAGATPIFPIR